MLDIKLIHAAEQFLKDTFANSLYLQKHPNEAAYRIEHSYRVANIAKQIARNEDFDVTAAIVAGLLHDIAYCEEMPTWEERKEHGRRGAELVRPFLEEQGISTDRINEICYGIAIHVDDTSSFEWKRTPFTETVGDADNIDRFDAYRIYETLQMQNFSDMPIAEKEKTVERTLDKLREYNNIKLGTKTAQALWQQRIDFYIAFYEKLAIQLQNSTGIE